MTDMPSCVIAIGSQVRVTSRSGNDYDGCVVAVDGDMVSVDFNDWVEARDGRELAFDEEAGIWRPLKPA